MIQEPVVQAPRGPAHASHRPPLKVVRAAHPPEGQKPKLLDQVRQAIRTRHYSYKTEKTYVGWMKRFIFFHNKRHPVEMGEAEIAHFLSSLADDARLSASTQNQALNAILFLYREVLGKEIGYVNGVVRARRPNRLPVVLTRQEVKAILSVLNGTEWLMATLLYGAGLRLMECMRLRVKDVDFSTNQIVVRSGKGNKDRLTMLPSSVKEPLQKHLGLVRKQYQADMESRYGGVSLPICPRTKISQCGQGMGLAVGVPGFKALYRSAVWGEKAAPSPRIGSPADDKRSRAKRGDLQACKLSHLPSLVCDPLT